MLKRQTLKDLARWAKNQPSWELTGREVGLEDRLAAGPFCEYRAAELDAIRAELRARGAIPEQPTLEELEADMQALRDGYNPRIEREGL